jgi:hypothetical protein
METYARLHGVTARGRSRTTSQSPIRVPEEGKFLQPETDDFITEALARLDQQVNSLSAQVLSAVRAVSTMQELMQSVVARVRTLESGGSKNSEHMLALHSDSVRNVLPSTSVVQSVDERLRGRFLELQAWQADVEEAISQLVREASREPNRHIKRAVASDLEPSKPRSASPRRVSREVGQKTEATIALLEEDLRSLRQHLEAGASIAKKTQVADLQATRDAEQRLSLGDHKDVALKERASLERLYEDLLQVSKSSRHSQPRRRANSSSALRAVSPPPLLQKRRQGP